MKSDQTIAARARSIVLEIFAGSTEGELARIMDLGLPYGVFLDLSASATPLRSTVSSFSEQLCSSSNRDRGLSGLKPRVFLLAGLSELEAVASTAEAIFEMARAVYLELVNGSDMADLDAWLSGEFRIELREVSERFLSAYGDDRSMLRIGTAEAPRALCSFTALRRLVLIDG